MITNSPTRLVLGLEFSTRLNALMQARGWSAADLKSELNKRYLEGATKVTASLGTIHAYMRGGGTVPSAAVLNALAVTFGCQRTDLAPGPSRQGCRDDKHAVVEVKDYGLARAHLKVDVILPEAEAEKIAAVLRASFAKRGIVVYT